MITTRRKMTDSPIVHRIVGLIEEQGKKDEEYTQTEKEMIRIYRSLDNGRKKCIRDTLKYFANGTMMNSNYVVEGE